MGRGWNARCPRQREGQRGGAQEVPPLAALAAEPASELCKQRDLSLYKISHLLHTLHICLHSYLPMPLLSACCIDFLTHPVPTIGVNNIEGKFFCGLDSNLASAADSRNPYPLLPLS